MNIEIRKESGKRIDSYLSDYLGISRSKVQKLIKEDLVLVNDKKVSSNYKIKDGDVILVNDDLNFEMDVKAEDIFVDVLYEDDDLLVINKKVEMFDNVDRQP